MINAAEYNKGIQTQNKRKVKNGSRQTFLTVSGYKCPICNEDLATKLKLPKKKCRIPIRALNELPTTTKHVVTVTIRSLQNDYIRSIEFLTIPSISEAVPCEAVRREITPILANVKLADPEFYCPLQWIFY